MTLASRSPQPPLMLGCAVVLGLGVSWGAVAGAQPTSPPIRGTQPPGAHSASFQVAAPRAPSVGAPLLGDEATRDTARELARQGLEAMNQEKYAEAEELFRKAYELVPAPTVGLLRGKALEKLGRWVEASQSYRAASAGAKAAEASEAFKAAAEEAVALEKALEAEMPHLTLTLRGRSARAPGVEVKIDDRRIPLQQLSGPIPVDPGAHWVTASVAGQVEDSHSLRVERHQSFRLVLWVESPRADVPAPPPAKSEMHDPIGWRRVGWGLVGVGSVALVTGALTGMGMLVEKSDLDRGCRPDCPANLQGELTAFRSYRAVSAVSYGLGFLGLGLGAGLVIGLAGPPKSPPSRPAGHRGGPEAQLRLGPASILLEAQIP